MSSGTAAVRSPPGKRRLVRETLVSLLVGLLAFLAWPIAEAVASAAMAARCAGWVAAGMGLGAWRGAVAAIDAGLSGAARAWRWRRAVAAGDLQRPRLRGPQP